MTTDGAPRQISLTWGLLCMIASLAVAIAANETFLPGRGKMVFLGVFITAFIAKSVAKEASRRIVFPFLGAVALFHLILIAFAPHDDLYPGGVLYPIGILDAGFWYLLFHWVQKNFAR